MAQLKKRQSDAIMALMKSGSVSEASRKTGVSRNTLCRWMSEPVFQRALREARGRAYLVAMSRLCQAASEAATKIIEGMRGSDLSKTAYLCARSVLEFASQAAASDIEMRMDEIEQKLEAFSRGEK